MLSQSRKKIKVLYPVLHYPPVIGGLEQWEQNIAERQGDNAEVIVVTGRVVSKANFEKTNNVLIFRTSFLELRNLSYSSHFYILSAMPFVLCRSLILLFTHKINLLHCHGFTSAVMGCILSLITNRPFMGTEQSIGWAHGSLKWLRGLVYKKAKLCIASSEAVRDEFRALGVDAKKIEIIPNGVDWDEFMNSQRKTSPGVFRILCVGRLEKVKGQAYLIEAFRKIQDKISQSRFPELRLLLTLVGDGSEKANLKKKVLELGLNESVEFVGEVRHDNLPEYFAKADVAAIPSLSEGFGIVALEAIASGVPIVASRVGGLTDIQKDFRTGFLVEPGDAEALASAIMSCINNPEFRYALGAEGKDLVRVNMTSNKYSKYSWDLIARRVGQLYAEEI